MSMRYICVFFMIISVICVNKHCTAQKNGKSSCNYVKLFCRNECNFWDTNGDEFCWLVKNNGDLIEFYYNVHTGKRERPKTFDIPVFTLKWEIANDTLKKIYNEKDIILLGYLLPATKLYLCGHGISKRSNGI